MPADPPSSPALRASDADRDRVIDVLRAAVADGRPDQTEFDERLDGALAARTLDALAPLTADLITIDERHGSVRRDGRWTLPHRLALRTVRCDVMLDLTSAVPSGPELVIESRYAAATLSWCSRRAWWWTLTSWRCGTPGWRSAGTRATTPETLCVRLAGRMRHGRIGTRWRAPRS